MCTGLSGAQQCIHQPLYLVPLPIKLDPFAFRKALILHVVG